MQAMLTAPSSIYVLTPHRFLITSVSLPIQLYLKFKKSNSRTGVLLLPPKCSPGETQDTDKSDDVEKLPISSSPPSSSSPELGVSGYNWCAGLGGLGFIETAYLTYLKLTNSEPFCPIGGGSCSDVLTSDYATVLGVPLPLIGFTSYGLVLLLALKLGGWNLPVKVNQTDGRLLLLSITASMSASSAYFLYILSAEFGGALSCSYCLGSAVLSFSLFFIILKDFGLQEVQKVVLLPLFTAAVALGVLSSTYSALPPTSPSSAAMEFPYYRTEITAKSSPFAMSLAKHLRSMGAKMYGAFWCTHCQEQKEMFGRVAADLLNYVECFPNGFKKGTVMIPACAEIGLEGFPTWVINDEVISGEKTLEELAQISGFHGDEVSQPN